MKTASEVLSEMAGNPEETRRSYWARETNNIATQMLTRLSTSGGDS